MRITWGKAGIAAAGAVLFAIVVQVSAAGVFALSKPLRAISVVPADAGARAQLAERIAMSEDPGQSAAARKLAEDALRRDLTQTPAIRALALLEPGTPQGRARALELMIEAQRVAKRDAATHMWFVDKARQQGDRAALVYHLDLALRTSASARTSIFAILDAATADPQVANLMLQTLGRRPNWAPAYALYAVRNGTNLAFGERVARLLLDPRDDVGRGQYFMLLQRLADTGKIAEAWSIYRDPALGLSAPERPLLRNGTFDGAEDTSRFDWSYPSETTLWVSKEEVRGQGLVLRTGAAEGLSGEVARQIVRLPGGRYRLAAKFGDLSPGTQTGPRVVVECTGQGGGSALARLVPAAGSKAPLSVETDFSVPRECLFQLVTIQVTGGGRPRDVLPWIDDVSIGGVR